MNSTLIQLKIASLYCDFDKKAPVNYKAGARVYGVYYDYQSDAQGAYSVLAGTDSVDDAVSSSLEAIRIAKGKYMVFEAKGEIPAVVLETWGKIWSYFSAHETPKQRAYTADFEYYKTQNEIEIFITIK